MARICNGDLTVAKELQKTFDKCPVPGCVNKRTFGQYLCKPHWRQLPDETRKTLRIDDRHARDRLRLVIGAVRHGWPLERIFIVDSPHNGHPRLARGKS
jgi:hypothetical protein